MQEVDQIRLSAKVIYNFTKEKYRFITDVQIKEWLHDNGWKAGNATTFEYCFEYSNPEKSNNENVVQISNKARDVGRCYTFRIEQFLSAEEIEDLGQAVSQKQNNN